jgi:hypothetical protein
VSRGIYRIDRVHQSFGSEAARCPQPDDFTRKPPKREMIVSPTERRNLVNRFVFYGRSVTKLASEYWAHEQAVENVIRQDLYKVFPPTTGRRQAA